MDRLAILLIIGMLFTGTINTLSKTWQNQQHSIGIDGKCKPFHFPWTQTLIMYCGETLCMLVFLILWNKKTYDTRARAEQKAINQTEETLLMSREDDSPPEKRDWKSSFLFLFASSLDLVGTTLAGIGLLYTFPSIYQMLRGSIIIFSGGLSVVFLKRKLYAYNLLGNAPLTLLEILITTCGLVVVGVASLLEDRASGANVSRVLFGNILVVAGQFANAVQFIVEEIYLKKKKFSPLLVVGAEGCWGILLMCALVLPIVYFIPGSDDGHYEDALDAAVMIYNSHRLLAFVLLYWLSIAFYNFFGLSVAKQLTAVHRTFIDAVWAAEIILYYALKGETGEAWQRYSFLELFGFALLVLGTATYNTSIRYPGLYYPPKS